MDIKRLAISAIGLLLVATLPLSAMAEATPRKGEAGGIKLVSAGQDPIPFDLKALDGSNVKLDDLKGKKAVMMVFWSLFCGPCQEELPLIDQMHKKYGEKGLEVLAINLDGEKRGRAVQKYMDKKEYSFTVLWEVLEGINYMTADAYGVLGTPTMVVVGKSGKITYAHVGQTDEPTLEKVVAEALSN